MKDLFNKLLDLLVHVVTTVWNVMYDVVVALFTSISAQYTLLFTDPSLLMNDPKAITIVVLTTLTLIFLLRLSWRKVEIANYKRMKDNNEDMIARLSSDISQRRNELQELTDELLDLKHVKDFAKTGLKERLTSLGSTQETLLQSLTAQEDHWDEEDHDPTLYSLIAKGFERIEQNIEALASAQKSAQKKAGDEGKRTAELLERLANSGEDLTLVGQKNVSIIFNESVGENLLPHDVDEFDVQTLWQVTTEVDEDLIQSIVERILRDALVWKDDNGDEVNRSSVVQTEVTDGGDYVIIDIQIEYSYSESDFPEEAFASARRDSEKARLEVHKYLCKIADQPDQ